MRAPIRTLCLSLLLPTLSWAASPDDFRGSAQKGLNFLGDDTVRWQKSNNCYGCHVQAVRCCAAFSTRREARTPRAA
jgi:hypothetical protein